LSLIAVLSVSVPLRRLRDVARAFAVANWVEVKRPRSGDELRQLADRETRRPLRHGRGGPRPTGPAYLRIVVHNSRSGGAFASTRSRSTKRKRIVVDLPMTSQPFPDPPTSYMAARPGEALAISDDGRYVAAGNLDPAVHVFDLAQGGKELVLSTSLDIVNAIAFAPGGGWLAATGKGGSMTTFELPSSASARRVR